MLPSTIARNARAQGLPGNEFVRDVLGVKNYSSGNRVSPTEDATIQYVREVNVVIDNVNRGETIDLKDLNQSSENLNEVLKEETETSLDSKLSNERTRRDLERAHKSINTLTRQIAITGAKIEGKTKK